MRKSLLALIAVWCLVLFAAGASADGTDYDRGVALLRAGRAEEALKLLAPLAAKGSDDPYLYYHLGLSYYKTGRLAKAYDAFSRTHELAGGKASEFGLSAAFSNIGVAHYRNREYDEAKRCLERAIGLDPNDGDSRYYMGLTHLAAADYKGALAELEKAARLKSGDPKAQAAVSDAAGLAYAGLGDNYKALAAFSRAMELDRSNLDALYYTAVINYKENGYAAAKPYFDEIAKAVKDAPDEKTKSALFTAFFNMGVDFQDRDQPGSAAEMFAKAVELKPDDAEAHYYLGYNLVALERYEEAVDELRKALAADPSNSRAEAQLEVAGRFASEKALSSARQATRKGEIYAALPLYMKAASLDPANEEAKRALTQATDAVEKDTKERARAVREYIQAGEYAKARAGARELMRLNPGGPIAAALERDVEAAVSSAADSLMAKAKSAEDDEALSDAASMYAKVLVLRPGDKKAEPALKRVKAAMDEFASSMAKATVSLEADEFSKASANLSRALSIKPHDRDAQALNKRISSRVREVVQRNIREGEGFLEEGRKEKAAGSFRAALALDPDNAQARRGLDKALYVPPAQPAAQEPQPASSGPVDEAEVRRVYLMGVEHYTKGELAEAIACWKDVLRLDPGNEKAISSIQKAEEKLKTTSGRPQQGQ